MVLANRFVRLARPLGSGEEQFPVSTGTQLIDGRVPLALVWGGPRSRGVLLLLLLLLLLPGRVALARWAGRLQPFHEQSLRLQLDRTVHALELQIR